MAEVESKEKRKVVVPTSATDLQRIKLDKLMKKHEKDVFIPEAPGSKLPRVFTPPEFIRNIWGSSAGAGSGDFHVYRGVRRREYARQKFLNEISESDKKDAEFMEKLGKNKLEAEKKTSKKRAKRLQKKQKQKAKKLKSTKESSKKEEDSEEDEESDAED